MSNPPDGSRGLLFKRVIWLIMAVALITAVVSIYLFLRPAPRRLADPEEFSLAEGERFVLEDLPMGTRYRLRACERSSELRVRVGTWSLPWTQLKANPIDNPARDLKLDGRAGGSLEIEVRGPTGRLIIFRDNLQVTCRGDDPRDLTFSSQRSSQQLPPFECEPDRLAGFDAEALEMLRAELQARHGMPLTPDQHRRLEGLTWFQQRPAAGATPLSAEEETCLERLSELAAQSPARSPALTEGALLPVTPAGSPAPAGGETGETGNASPPPAPASTP